MSTDAGIDDTGGDGPPIVFSHDVDHDRRMFDGQRTYLSDIYRVLTWDRPEVDSSQALWGLVDDLFHMLDSVEIERAVLVGSGEGAALSLRAALEHPDRVRALVLIACDARDLADRLDELAMPVLLIHGTGHDAVPLEHIYDINALVSDPRGVIEVSGALDTPSLTHSEVVNPALRTFFEDLPG